jgi:shikimate kinase
MKINMPYQRIVLIGFKGSGKTRIGKLLAKKAGFAFMDIDTLIEKEYAARAKGALSVRAIYKKFGRDHFLRLEGRALKKAATAKRAVVSLGGGSPLNAGFSKKSFGNAAFVYLQVKPGTLYRRIARKGLPPFFSKTAPRKSFQALYDERTPVYARVADITADNTRKAPARTCREIVAGLGGISDE